MKLILFEINFIIIYKIIRQRNDNLTLFNSGENIRVYLYWKKSKKENIDRIVRKCKDIIESLHMIIK